MVRSGDNEDPALYYRDCWQGCYVLVSYTNERVAGGKGLVENIGVNEEAGELLACFLLPETRDRGILTICL